MPEKTFEITLLTTVAFSTRLTVLSSLSLGACDTLMALFTFGAIFAGGTCGSFFSRSS